MEVKFLEKEEYTHYIFRITYDTPTYPERNRTEMVHHEVEIKIEFHNGKFVKAGYDLRAPYSLEDWEVLTRIRDLIQDTIEGDYESPNKRISAIHRIKTTINHWLRSLEGSDAPELLGKKAGYKHVLDFIGKIELND